MNRCHTTNPSPQAALVNSHGQFNPPHRGAGLGAATVAPLSRPRPGCHPRVSLPAAVPVPWGSSPAGASDPPIAVLGSWRKQKARMEVSLHTCASQPFYCRWLSFPGHLHEVSLAKYFSSLLFLPWGCTVLFFLVIYYTSMLLPSCRSRGSSQTGHTSSTPRPGWTDLPRTSPWMCPICPSVLGCGGDTAAGPGPTARVLPGAGAAERPHGESRRDRRCPFRSWPCCARDMGSSAGRALCSGTAGRELQKHCRGDSRCRRNDLNLGWE